jgi:hypothetical protein
VTTTETVREVAEDIAKDCVNWPQGYKAFARAVDAIEAAINARDERAAKILEDRVLALKSVTHPTNHNTWEQLDLLDLAAKIRGKQ